MSYDALIVGGGPAGATAAILLARAGWSVVLAEKKQFPRRKVCGEFISASSMPLLRQLGIAAQFEAQAGPPVTRVGLFAGEHMLDAPMPPVEGSQAWGRALGRESLDTVLIVEAVRAGATVLQPAAVKAVERQDHGTTATVAESGDVKKITARLVIAAHGSWEPQPFSTQLSAPHCKSDLLGFKAHFSNAALPPGLMPLLVFPGGYGGMVHTDRGRVSLSCCIRRDVLRDLREKNSGAAADVVFAHIRASCRGVTNALSDATLDDHWLAAGPIRPGIRARVRDGVFLVGNAAGEAHPIVAEGISMAMQSAWLLTRALTSCDARAAAGAQAEAGRIYSAAWSRAFAPRIQAAALFAQFAQRPVLAELANPLLARFPALLTFGAWLSGKTNVVTRVAA